uniref:Uncharacterized protein n=1 Tax=Nelumbo nucifera TaxID=4432 RepID=A0A822ZN39_NELNU|nr:TPA_asm: hypothetical protein HUJ06_016579 [Nelumbo nucifera]
MHAKSDSEVTSIDASTPPRSPRRPLYYVQSPSQHDLEKMSYGSSPLGSPQHHYHCSPIHHSRESSTSRFSASLKQPRNPAAWKKINQHLDDDDDDENDDGIGDRGSGNLARFYVVCFVFSFAVLFTVFSLILWGASKPYKPKISIKVGRCSLFPSPHSAASLLHCVGGFSDLILDSVSTRESFCVTQRFLIELEHFSLGRAEGMR